MTSNGAMNRDVAPDISIPIGLIRNLRQNMSSAASGNNSGENSDNSGASLSIGNNSFGFNFDSDEMNKIGDVTLSSGGMTSSSGDSYGRRSSSRDALRFMKPGRGGGAGGNNPSGVIATRKSDVTKESSSSASVPPPSSDKGDASVLPESDARPEEGAGVAEQQQQQQGRAEGNPMQVSQPKTSSAVGPQDRPNDKDPSAAKAAAATVTPSASASSASCSGSVEESMGDDSSKRQEAGGPSGPALSVKRMHPEDKADQNSEGGYNSDDEACSTSAKPSQVPSSTAAGGEGGTGEPPRKAKRGLDESKREERNAREKDRSFRITLQIDELRTLLSTGGVIVPKGTKSSVLTEAANYIRMLQQHQYRSELDRQKLVQQIQLIGSGALGPQAASIVRHAAAKNGVWCLGNFGGVPPQSAMVNPLQVPSAEVTTSGQQAPVDVRQVTEIEEEEFRQIFNSCSIAMAVASMGGAFIDCNRLFCQLSGFTKQELCAMTVFNLTARADLQSAFDRISSMIAPPTDGTPEKNRSAPILLGGAMKAREDLSIRVSLVRGNDGVLKCFCVTLMAMNTPPFSDGKASFASFGALRHCQAPGVAVQQVMKKPGEAPVASPTYTAG